MTGKRKIHSACIIGITAIMLSGCGDYGSRTSNGITADEFSSSDAVGYYSNEWSENTYIDGDLVDYSYNLSMEGDVENKDTVLDFYEEMQNYVESEGGYVEDVNNSYSLNSIDYDCYITGSEKRNSATGYASFTIQIEEDKVEGCLEKLNDFCKEQGFDVTQYTQTITNYENVSLADNDAESEETGRITKTELEKKLKYSDIDVIIRYNIPRTKSVQIMISIRQFLSDFGSMIAGVLVGLIVLILTVYVLLAIAVLPAMKLFIKNKAEYYRTHPEYRKSIIVNIQEEKKNEESEENF